VESMNARQRRYVAEAAFRTSEALDGLRSVEERQALINRPRLVRKGDVSVDFERDHWERLILWQGVAVWSEDPSLMVETVRAVMRIRPEHSRWRLHKLCQIWAKVGGPDWPVLGPAKGPWRASLKPVSESAA
jgi:hypothetical protein